MKKHLCPNKFYYSFYSVFLAGTLFLLAMYAVFLAVLKNTTSFPCFMCIVTALVGFFVLISNQFLILHEKFRPQRLMGLVIVAGAAVMFAANYYIPFKAVNYLTYYANITFFGFLIMSGLAAKRKPVYDSDYVIILGCSIARDGHLLPLLKARVNRAIRFAWEQEINTGKPVKFVPSGGQGKDEIMSEGSAMELYLLAHAAEDYEVFPDKKSKNTYENMLFSKAIIDKKTKDAKVSFCTTNYHVFRSGILTQKAKVDAQGISSATKWYFWPNALIREYVGFLSLFPVHHAVLSILAIVLSLGLFY